MVSSLLLLSTAFASLALGSPAATGLTNAQCRPVKAIVSVLGADPAASAYCSSYLGITTAFTTTTSTIRPPRSTSTFTTNVTTVTSTRKPSTTIITSTSTITPSAIVVTENVTSTITSPMGSSAPPVFSTVTQCTLSNVDPNFANQHFARRTAIPLRVLASSLSTFNSAEVSTACECMGVTTPTSTLTSTTTISSTTIKTISATATIIATQKRQVTTQVSVTTTTLRANSTTTTATIYTTMTQTRNAPPTFVHTVACATPTSSCGNQGMQWAAYRLYQANSNYWDPTSIQNQALAYGPGVIDTLAGTNLGTDGDGYFYNVTTPVVPTEFLVLNQVGYIYAEESGTYTMKNTYANDWMYVWIGRAAYSGWNKYNANMYASFEGGSFTFTMTAGNYYPIRVIFANSYGGGAFDLQILDPQGVDIMDSYTGGLPYLVQYSCDESTAPKFPDYSSGQHASPSASASASRRV